MVFRWFLWVRRVLWERERSGLGLCVACFLCLCLSEFHSCCKFFDASITMTEEKIYHVPTSNTYIHSITWEWMYEYDTCKPPRKWKGERSIWNSSTFPEYCLYHCIVSSICTEIDWCSQHIYVTMFCTNETGFRWVWHLFFLELSI